jgi:pimeloyl-ACP methyl ester carboxylesterase
MAEVLFRGGKIHYTFFGSGEALVLLHGFLEDMRMFDNWEKHFGNKHKYILIDLPGHGRSESFGYVHSMELMAEAVKAVLDELRIRKCVLLGHSMGGYVGLAFAEKWADMVKKLVLYHSTPFPDSLEKKEQREKAIMLVKSNHQSFVRKAIPLLFRAKFRKLKKEEINQLKQKALRMSAQGIIAALSGMKTRLSRDIILKFCPFKVLLVVGRKDPVIDFRQLLPLKHICKNVDVLLLEESGHMSFIECPEEAFPSIIDFLKKT